MSSIVAIVAILCSSGNFFVPETHDATRKTLINFRPFTLARMPAKAVSEI